MNKIEQTEFNKIYLVVEDICHDCENDIRVTPFSTKESAQQFIRHLVTEYKKDNPEIFENITYTPDVDLEEYDSGWIYEDTINTITSYENGSYSETRYMVNIQEKTIRQ